MAYVTPTKKMLTVTATHKASQLSYSAYTTDSIYTVVMATLTGLTPIVVSQPITNLQGNPSIYSVSAVWVLGRYSDVSHVTAKLKISRGMFAPKVLEAPLYTSHTIFPIK